MINNFHLVPDRKTIWCFLNQRKYNGQQKMKMMTVIKKNKYMSTKINKKIMYFKILTIWIKISIEVNLTFNGTMITWIIQNIQIRSLNLHMKKTYLSAKKLILLTHTIPISQRLNLQTTQLIGYHILIKSRKNKKMEVFSELIQSITKETRIQ